MTTTLVIARHGNTFAPNEIPTRVGARTDLPLSSSGEEQALRLGYALKGNNLIPAHVYTSQLRRTIDTARLACVSMACAAENETTDFLNEIDYGPDENKPDVDVHARIGHEALERWDAEGVMPDGWSPSPEIIIQGWKNFLQKIDTKFSGKTVLAVTSNGIARFARNCAVNGQDFPLKLGTGMYGVLKKDADGQWRMQEWNVRPY